MSITSLAKEVSGGYVFGSVGLIVCLSVYEQHYSQSYKRIAKKFYEGVWGSKKN